MEDDVQAWREQAEQLYAELRCGMRSKWQRDLPFEELLHDR